MPHRAGGTLVSGSKFLARLVGAKSVPGPGVSGVTKAEASSGEPIFRCPEELRPEALEVLYRRIPAEFRAGVIAEALGEASAGRLDLSLLWVARRRGRLIGALLTHPLAGRAAAIWPPEVEASWGRGAVASGLLRASLADLRSRGFRLAQALVDPSGPATVGVDLVRGGLPPVTTLTFLERTTNAPIRPDPSGRETPAGFAWRRLGPDTEADFCRTLEATYRASLDMPELDGIRSLDDVLASHRAAGRFDPTHWSVGHLDGDPAAGAVLLLSEVVDRPAWEITYLGLTPEARGRGLGRSALAFALSEAKAAGVARLELAVDARNTPARRLYDGAGFRAFDRRIVHLTTFDQADGAGTPSC